MKNTAKLQSPSSITQNRDLVNTKPLVLGSLQFCQLTDH